MWTRTIFGLALCVVGAVWIGQGVGVIHGSFMTGETFWAIVGSVLLVVGLALVYSGLRQRNRRAA
jgi:hypothetical protein